MGNGLQTTKQMGGGAAMLALALLFAPLGQAAPLPPTPTANGDEFWYEPTKSTEADGAAFTMQNGEPVVTGENGTPANFTILGVQESSRGNATLGLYTRPGGGTVFNAAANAWTRGLSAANNPQGYQVVQRITRNVMDTLSATATSTPSATPTGSVTPTPSTTANPTGSHRRPRTRDAWENHADHYV